MNLQSVPEIARQIDGREKLVCRGSSWACCSSTSSRRELNGLAALDAGPSEIPAAPRGSFNDGQGASRCSMSIPNEGQDALLLPSTLPGERQGRSAAPRRGSRREPKLAQRATRLPAAPRCFSMSAQRPGSSGLLAGRASKERAPPIAPLPHVGQQTSHDRTASPPPTWSTGHT